MTTAVQKSAVPVYRALRLRGAATVKSLLAAQPASEIRLAKPHLWPGPAGGKTVVRAFYNDAGLHSLFSIFGSFREPSASDTSSKDSILDDDRVEIFCFPDGSSDQYIGNEVNRAGRSYDFKAKFVRQFSNWSGKLSAEFVAAEAKRDSGNANADEKSASSDEALAGYMRLSIPWSDLQVDPKRLPKSLRLGFYRGERTTTRDGKPDFIWTSWVDPNSEDVNFHCAATFGQLELADEDAKSA